MVVTRCHIGRQRTQRIERRLVAGLELPLHVFPDLVHRHVAGAFDHYLYVVGLRDAVQLAERLELGKLCRVIRIRYRARAQAVAERERHVVS